MNTAADNILAKSFARERRRIWAPIVKKYATIGDLLTAANQSYASENDELKQLAKTPPSQERYIRICTLLKQAYAHACAENDPTIMFADFADKAFCLLGESPKGQTAQDPKDLLYTKEEVDAYNSVALPTLATMNLWVQHVIYLELPTERHIKQFEAFRKTDFSDLWLWNQAGYSLMRDFYASRKNLQLLYARFEFLIPILGEEELRRQFESTKLSDILNEKTIEQGAQINADFIRLACTNPSVDLNDAAADNLLRTLTHQNTPSAREFRRSLNNFKDTINLAKTEFAASRTLTAEDQAELQAAEDLLARMENQFDLSKESPADNTIAKAVAEEIRKEPLDTRVIDVATSAGKSLRAALKDPGGRPEKADGVAMVMTQSEMAQAFGEPCNTQMIANWEARAAGKKRGANPPDAEYKGERIVYSAEIRTNPTPENKIRLSVLIAEFQARHRIKSFIGQKTVHMKSAETLARASGQIDSANRGQRTI